MIGDSNSSFWPRINAGSDVPAYRQFVDAVVRNVENGTYSAGLRMPSLNEMAGILGISKETVYKAYSSLCSIGVLSSSRGRGYFVSDRENGTTSVLILLSELNPNMMTIVMSFMQKVGDRVKVTIKFHNQDPDIFKNYVNVEFGRYDYYVVFPHFDPDRLSQEQITAILNGIPPERLIVMDRYLPGLGKSTGASYQYIFGDVCDCLGDQGVLSDFRRYNRLKSLPVYTSLYGKEVNEALRLFCGRNHIPYEEVRRQDLKVFRGDVFFIYGCSLGYEVEALAETIKAADMVVGKDVGIICFDDFQVNGIVLGGLTTLSTDYVEMGENAADMILTGSLRQIHCRSSLIRRNSF